MHPIDRFTRDEASAKVWWIAALVLIVAFVLTFPGQDRAIQRTRSQVAEDATALVTNVIDPIVTGGGDTAEVLADDVVQETPGVTAVRVWDDAGAMLISTLPDDEIGSKAALNDEFLAAALSGEPDPVSEQSETTLVGEPGEPRFRVFTALSSVPGTVAEIEYADDVILRATRDLWRTIQIVLGVAALLVLGLALLSMREPVAPIGAGVRFYPTSVPPGTIVLEASEAEELRQAGAYARKRIESQQERLDELEAAKLRLEGDLQRALSSRSMPAGTTPAIPRPGGQAPIEPPMPDGMPAREPAPEVPVLRIPDAEPAPEPVESPEPEPVEATASEPVAATPEPEPEPEPVPEATASAPPPVVVVPEAEPIAPAPAPAPRRAPTQPKAPKTAPAAAKDDSMGFVSTPPAERAAPAQPTSEKPAAATPAAAEPAAEVVRVPEPDDDGRHDAEVLDVLERLVEPIGTAPATDPGEMRARLARTAAAKKPGSRSDDRFHE